MAITQHTQNQLCVTPGFARKHISVTQNCGPGLLSLTGKLVNRYIPHAKCSYVYRLQTDLPRNTYHCETPKTPHDKRKVLLRRHSCVLVNIILMGAACYHLPGNEPTTISHTQNVAMCTACKLIYHVTHTTVKPQKPLTISGKGYYDDIVAY